MSRPLLPANTFGDLSGQHTQLRPAAGPSDLSGVSGEVGAGGGEGAVGAGGSRSGKGGSKPTYSKRGKITIVACVPCRKRKTKCDGKRPSCGQCSSRESSCHYDMTDDQRKLTYLRDNVEQLQEKSSTMESLLHTIQAANEEEASEIYRRLRSGTDVQIVADQIQAGRLLSGVGRRESDAESLTTRAAAEGNRTSQYEELMRTLATGTQTECNDVIRRIRAGEDVSAIMEAATTGNLSTQRLVQRNPGESQEGLETDFSSQESTFGMVKGAPMRRTHASLGAQEGFEESKESGQPWTTVTKSREIVEYLLAMYFTWQHSFFQSFPEKLFRADMEAGRTKYCSSMLVNAICASGCFLCDSEHLAKLGLESLDISARFYDAAVAQLDSNKSSTVPTTAALYLISYYEGTRGRLSNLWMFSGRSALMAIDINLHLSRSQKQSDDPAERQERENERQARCHAFWGAFHVDQMTAFTLGRLPNLNGHGVTQELPQISEEEDREPWSAPEIEAPSQRPGARGSTFAHCTLLSKIINSTLLMFFAPILPLSGSLLVDEYEKYLDWYNALPPAISSTNNAPPHVICLHMYYNVAVLHLFRPFLKATIDNSQVVPRDVCRQSANAISELWLRHKAIYGLRGIYMFQTHCLLAACTIHIINIPSISATRHFTEACNTFQELIPRNEWARSSLKVLRSLVEKWGLILPLEAEEALCRDEYSEENQGMERTPDSLPELLHATDPSLVFQGAGSLKVSSALTPRPEESQPSRPNTRPHVGTQSVHATAESPATRGPAPGTMQSSQVLAAKRPPSGEVSPAPQLASGTSQKKQRMMAPHAPSSLTDEADPSLSANPRDPSRPSAASYLYSPLAGHPAPMLVPVVGAGRGRGRPSSLATETPASAQPEPSANAAEVTNAMQVEQPLADQARSSNPSGQPNPPQAGPSAAHPRPSRPIKKEGDGLSGVETGVEGLSFGDDWRDPFMGYLGQEE